MKRTTSVSSITTSHPPRLCDQHLIHESKTPSVFAPTFCRVMGFDISPKRETKQVGSDDLHPVATGNALIINRRATSPRSALQSLLAAAAQEDVHGEPELSSENMDHWNQRPIEALYMVDESQEPEFTDHSVIEKPSCSVKQTAPYDPDVSLNYIFGTVVYDVKNSVVQYEEEEANGAPELVSGHSSPETPALLAKMDFLAACHLCQRPLVDGIDIYMYRGEKAFCSLECRHENILIHDQDERSPSVSSSLSSPPIRIGTAMASNAGRSIL